jgi:hypothetical protein
LVKLSYKGNDLVPAKLPSGNKESCKTRYFEEEPPPTDKNMLVSGRFGVGHRYYASAARGMVTARASEYGPMYMYATDQGAAPARMAKTIIHVGPTTSAVHRGRKIHTAHS